MFCRQQLADFQKRLADFDSRNIFLLALSVDSLEDAKKTVDRYKLTLPVAYGVNAQEFSETTGAFYDAKNGFLHATGYVIDPDGKITVAVYSTGPIGHNARIRGFSATYRPSSNRNTPSKLLA